MTKHDNYKKFPSSKKNNPQHYKDREGLLTTTDNPNKSVNAVIALLIVSFLFCFIFKQKKKFFHPTITPI